jgi:hypothetical protein
MAKVDFLQCPNSETRRTRTDGNLQEQSLDRPLIRTIVANLGRLARWVAPGGSYRAGITRRADSAVDPRMYIGEAAQEEAT